jgi:exodeoxyribonuclease VII small subunit
MPRKKTKTDFECFETSLERLKEIVSQLENGKLTLSESLERYEEGIKNLKECYEALNQAQLKIEQLVSLDENGKLITTPFDGTASFELPNSGQFGTGSASYSRDQAAGKKEGKSTRRSTRTAVSSINLDEELVVNPDKVARKRELQIDFESAHDEILEEDCENDGEDELGNEEDRDRLF